jgi:hypothetical protein
MKWLQSKRRLLLKPRKSLKAPRGNTLRDHHKYDESTGQVYSETTAEIQGADDRNWTNQTHVVAGPDYRWSDESTAFFCDSDEKEVNIGAYHDHLDGLKNTRLKRFKGARSLQDAAVECILHNISDVTLEGLACLPTPLVRRIWHAVNKRLV